MDPSPVKQPPKYYPCPTCGSFVRQNYNVIEPCVNPSAATSRVFVKQNDNNVNGNEPCVKRPKRQHE